MYTIAVCANTLQCLNISYCIGFNSNSENGMVVWGDTCGKVGYNCAAGVRKKNQIHILPHPFTYLIYKTIFHIVFSYNDPFICIRLKKINTHRSMLHWIMRNLSVESNIVRRCHLQSFCLLHYNVSVYVLYMTYKYKD